MFVAARGDKEPEALALSRLLGHHLAVQWQESASSRKFGERRLVGPPGFEPEQEEKGSMIARLHRQVFVPACSSSSVSTSKAETVSTEASVIKYFSSTRHSPRLGQPQIFLAFRARKLHHYSMS